MDEKDTEKDTLYILWTTGDVHTARFMVMMYARNSMINRWWDNVTVILWGASEKLAAEDPAVQHEIKIAQHVGVNFTACVACARQLGVVDELQALGIEVKGWGEPLTLLLKDNEKLITI